MKNSNSKGIFYPI